LRCHASPPPPSDVELSHAFMYTAIPGAVRHALRLAYAITPWLRFKAKLPPALPGPRQRAKAGACMQLEAAVPRRPLARISLPVAPQAALDATPPSCRFEHKLIRSQLYLPAQPPRPLPGRDGRTPHILPPPPPPAPDAYASAPNVRTRAAAPGPPGSHWAASCVQPPFPDVGKHHSLRWRQL
jgi:hypothetical protein